MRILQESRDVVMYQQGHQTHTVTPPGVPGQGHPAQRTTPPQGPPVSSPATPRELELKRLKDNFKLVREEYTISQEKAKRDKMDLIHKRNQMAEILRKMNQIKHDEGTRVAKEAYHEIHGAPPPAALPRSVPGPSKANPTTPLEKTPTPTYHTEPPLPLVSQQQNSVLHHGNVTANAIEIVSNNTSPSPNITMVQTARPVQPPPGGLPKQPSGCTEQRSHPQQQQLHPQQQKQQERAPQPAHMKVKPPPPVSKMAVPRPPLPAHKKPRIHIKSLLMRPILNPRKHRMYGEISPFSQRRNAVGPPSSIGPHHVIKATSMKDHPPIRPPMPAHYRPKKKHDRGPVGPPPPAHQNGPYFSKSSHRHRHSHSNLTRDLTHMTSQSNTKHTMTQPNVRGPSPRTSAPMGNVQPGPPTVRGMMPNTSQAMGSHHQPNVPSYPQGMPQGMSGAYPQNQMMQGGHVPSGYRSQPPQRIQEAFPQPLMPIPALVPGGQPGVPAMGRPAMMHNQAMQTSQPPAIGMGAQVAQMGMQQQPQHPRVTYMAYPTGRMPPPASTIPHRVSQAPGMTVSTSQVEHRAVRPTHAQHGTVVRPPAGTYPRPQPPPPLIQQPSRTIPPRGPTPPCSTPQRTTPPATRDPPQQSIPAGSTGSTPPARSPQATPPAIVSPSAVPVSQSSSPPAANSQKPEGQRASQGHEQKSSQGQGHTAEREQETIKVTESSETLVVPSTASSGEPGTSRPAGSGTSCSSTEPAFPDVVHTNTSGSEHPHQPSASSTTSNSPVETAVVPSNNTAHPTPGETVDTAEPNGNSNGGSGMDKTKEPKQEEPLSLTKNNRKNEEEQREIKDMCQKVVELASPTLVAAEISSKQLDVSASRKANHVTETTEVQGRPHSAMTVRYRTKDLSRRTSDSALLVKDVDTNQTVPERIKETIHKIDDGEKPVNKQQMIKEVRNIWTKLGCLKYNEVEEIDTTKCVDKDAAKFDKNGNENAEQKIVEGTQKEQDVEAESIPEKHPVVHLSTNGNIKEIKVSYDNRMVSLKDTIGALKERIFPRGVLSPKDRKGSEMPQKEILVKEAKSSQQEPEVMQDTDVSENDVATSSSEKSATQDVDSVQASKESETAGIADVSEPPESSTESRTESPEQRDSPKELTEPTEMSSASTEVSKDSSERSSSSEKQMSPERTEKSLTPTPEPQELSPKETTVTKESTVAKETTITGGTTVTKSLTPKQYVMDLKANDFQAAFIKSINQRSKCVPSMKQSSRSESRKRSHRASREDKTTSDDYPSQKKTPKVTVEEDIEEPEDNKREEDTTSDDSLDDTEDRNSEEEEISAPRKIIADELIVDDQVVTVELADGTTVEIYEQERTESSGDDVEEQRKDNENGEKEEEPKPEEPTVEYSQTEIVQEQDGEESCQETEKQDEKQSEEPDEPEKESTEMVDKSSEDWPSESAEAEVQESIEEQNNVVEEQETATEVETAGSATETSQDAQVPEKTTEEDSSTTTPCQTSYEDISPFPEPDREATNEEARESSEIPEVPEKVVGVPEESTDSQENETNIDILLEAQKVSGIVPENYEGEPTEAGQVPGSKSEAAANQEKLDQAWIGETSEVVSETTPADAQNEPDAHPVADSARDDSVVEYNDAVTAASAVTNAPPETIPESETTSNNEPTESTVQFQEQAGQEDTAVVEEGSTRNEEATGNLSGVANSNLMDPDVTITGVTKADGSSVPANEENTAASQTMKNKPRPKQSFLEQYKDAVYRKDPTGILTSSKRVEEEVRQILEIKRPRIEEPAGVDPKTQVYAAQHNQLSQQMTQQHLQQFKQLKQMQELQQQREIQKQQYQQKLQREQQLKQQQQQEAQQKAREDIMVAGKPQQYNQIVQHARPQMVPTSVIGVHRMPDSTPLTHDATNQQAQMSSHIGRQYQGSYPTDVAQTAYPSQYPPNKAVHQSVAIPQRQYNSQDRQGMTPMFPRGPDGNVPTHMRQAYDTYLQKQREQQMSRLGTSDTSGIHGSSEGYPSSMSRPPPPYMTKEQLQIHQQQRNMLMRPTHHAYPNVNVSQVGIGQQIAAMPYNPYSNQRTFQQQQQQQQQHQHQPAQQHSQQGYPSQGYPMQSAAMTPQQQHLQHSSSGGQHQYHMQQQQQQAKMQPSQGPPDMMGRTQRELMRMFYEQQQKQQQQQVCAMF